MTVLPETSTHAHRWVPEPVTQAVFTWSCECGEKVVLEWRAEWAGLGFEDIGRIVEAEFGGTVVPVHPISSADLPVTDVDAARERLAAILSRPLKPQLLPPRPLLTPETVRELLRECVTVVQPGEVLVMSMPDWMTPQHVREVADSVQWWREAHAPDLRVLVVPACDMAVAETESE